MPVYLSILRGINVSGKKPVKMDRLKSLFEDLDCSLVQTYIQSGNVIFFNASEDLEGIKSALEKHLQAAFGFEIPLITLEREKLFELAENNPFTNRSDIDPSYLHLTFFSGVPTLEMPSSISPNTFFPDEFSLAETCAYVYCPLGYGRTKLNNSFFEKKLGVSATTRNWKTVMELIRILGEY